MQFVRIQRMQQLAEPMDQPAATTYKLAHRNLESEWLATECALKDLLMQCSRALHAFINEVEFHVRDFENQLQLQKSQRKIDETLSDGH